MVNGVSHSTKLSDSRCTVYRHAKDTSKPRTLYSISELSANVDLAVNNADISTLECALMERMYYCKVGSDFVAPPPVRKGLFTERLSAFKNILLGNMRNATRWSYQQVLDTYSGRRRTIYQNAMNKLVQIGLSRDDAHSIAFVKMELVNPNKAPRCIQPRRPAYNLALGRYIKAIEHKLYKAIAKVYGDGPTVMKGYNVSEIGAIVRGKWRSFRKPVAVGLDATKFDMHVSPEALAWEHSVYLDLFNNCPELRKLLSWQMKNKGAGYCADGKLKYSVKGKRFSGDMNTGLGNCLLMCAMVYAWASSRGLHVKLLNNGDDCVVIMESEHYTQFINGLDQWFMEMGFRMVAEEPVYEMHKIEFCQMHPIEVGEECRMVRNIPATLRKDTLTVHPLTRPKHRAKWMTAVGTCGLWLTGGVPVLQDFYQTFQRVGCHAVSRMVDDPTFATGMRLMARGMEEQWRVPDAWTRVQVFEAWGISPDEQVAVEAYYRDYQLDPSRVRDEITNDNPLFNALWSP